MKSRQSNLHYFFLFLLTLIGFSSCSKGTDINEVWPDVRVNFEIYLDYYNLNGANSMVYLDEDDISTSAAGINNHGIYIINTGDGFLALDATCHHDQDIEEHVEISEDNDALGVCPECKSEFVFLNEGAVHKGPAEYSLKKYKTFHDTNNRTLRVWN